MSPVKQPWPDRFYGALLRMLPFEFRLEFGSDMEETFHMQRVETARECGFPALLHMWSATIADIVTMAPREHASVLWQDVRYALRMMRQNRGYTAAAVLILGLGIGVNTSIFSAVNSVLIKPLPYLRGDDLVVLRQSETKRGAGHLRFSVQEINDYRRQNRYLSAVAEYHDMTFTLLGGSEAQRVQAGVVSADFFRLFGVTPLLGRTFVADDDRPGAKPVLVLSYEYWKQSHHSDPNIVGKTFQMNDHPHVVIGVLPPIPQYPNENDVYMPTVACPWRSKPETIANRNIRGISLFGRLQPRVTLDECRHGLAVASRAMASENPASYPPELGIQTTASLLRNDLTSRVRPMLLALVGAAAIVLLIACANVANLTLARMARREHELVIRTAVGAGGGRLLRQLLTESLIMALLAAGVGVLFAAGSIKLLAQFAEPLTPRAREISIDGWVLAFAILCASATTIVCGSAAALYSRNNVAFGLKEGSRADAERRRHLVRSVLIAAQVAFSYVLLIGAGLMFHSFLRMNQADLGFTPQRVVAVSFERNWSRYNSAAAGRTISDRLLATVRSKPGVDLAALADSFPLDPDILAMRRQSDHQWHFVIEGDPRPQSESPPVRAIRSASPDYFPTLGIPILAGRTFLDSDTADAPEVVIVNQSLAQRAGGITGAVGHRISLNGGSGWATIVGVVGDTKEFGPMPEAPLQVYFANTQSPNPGSVLVRTTDDPKVMIDRVRQAILEVDPENAITQAETMEQVRADSVASPRTITRMFGLFAVFAFLIALAGIGSMLALWVRQRTREIGIRMAMGARPVNILRTVIRQGMLLVVTGLGAGFVGAIALTGFLRAFLFQVAPTDVATYATVSGLLLGAALFACYVPAIRAARIDPMVALRCD